MRGRHFIFTVVACAAAGAALGQDDDWYPSQWGAADQRGAANRVTPQKVLEAKEMMTRGAVYQLGRSYDRTMPLFGTRHFSLKIPQLFGPFGTNETTYHDELVSGELGQIGTQFDGLGHLGVGDVFYNGNHRRDFATADGLTKLGIENVGALVTRGVLVDVAAYKGVARLDGAYEITLADLRGTLDRQRVNVRSGDVVIVRPAEDADNGQIVVALFEDEATVKRFYREQDAVRLEPANPDYEPIVTRDVDIIGRVIGVFRKV